MNLKSIVLGIAVIGIVGAGIAGLAYGFGGNAQAGNSQTSAIWSWPPPATDDTLITGASSEIRRNKNGVNYVVNTSEMEPGAYTMWFVVFNDTDSCEGPCDAGDLMGGRGNSAAFWDGGRVVGPNGSANFAGFVTEGYLPSGPDQILKDNTGGAGMIDAETAEVHMVIRSHGPALTGSDLQVQLDTFNGACQPDPDSCKNYQFGVHLAPAN